VAWKGESILNGNIGTIWEMGGGKISTTMKSKNFLGTNAGRGFERAKGCGEECMNLMSGRNGVITRGACGCKERKFGCGEKTTKIRKKKPSNGKGARMHRG